MMTAAVNTHTIEDLVAFFAQHIIAELHGTGLFEG